MIGAQFVTRLDDELTAAVDALVADGVVASRSDAVRLGLRLIVERHRRAMQGAAIIDGYRHLPATDVDSGWPDEATVAMIAEEPW